MITAADKRILRVLQREGRITNQDLAQRCGLSSSACLERVKKLRENGFIKQFSAILDADKLGQNLMIFVQVQLDNTSASVLRDFAEAVKTKTEIMECHMLAGGIDYLLKIRLPDLASYRKFLGDTLITLPGVRETRTFTVLEEVKYSTEVSI